MTETKEDLQAQLDQLRDKWHADRDRYRIGPSKVLPPRNYNVAKGVLWGLGYVAWPLSMLVFAGLIFKDFIEYDPSESLSGSWFELRGPYGPISLLVGFLAWFVWFGREKKAKAYFLHLKSYESKRAELQAELDALD